MPEDNADIPAAKAEAIIVAGSMMHLLLLAEVFLPRTKFGYLSFIRNLFEAKMFRKSF
jgi:hypothetical protein